MGLFGAFSAIYLFAVVQLVGLARLSYQLDSPPLPGAMCDLHPGRLHLGDPHSKTKIEEVRFMKTLFPYWLRLAGLH